MAHTRSASPGVQRLTSLVATLLVAAATAFAFGRVYEGRAATLQLLLVAVLSGGLAWMLERRGLLVATLASAAALLVVLGLTTFRETTWFGLPTLETFRQMADAASAVSEQARMQVAPTPAIDPLMLAGVVATWASVFSCHALAFRAGSPLLALVPPVALLAFADTVLEEFVRPMYGVAFLVGALAVAFADNVRRTQSWGPIWSGRPGRTAVGLVGVSGRGARRLAVAALAVATIVPIAVPGFGSAGLIDLSAINDDDRLLVDPLASIASALTSDEPVEVLTVSTETPAYLRMLTLPDFDGITFRRAERASSRPFESVLRPPSTDAAIEHDIRVETDLGFPWVPAAAEPTTVTLADETLWDETNATLTLGDPLDAGTEYQVSSDLVQPTPEELRRTTAGLATLDPRYTTLPEDMPEEVRDLAVTWVEGETTDYDRVLAIQDQLRDGFHYTTNVDFRADVNTIVEFLSVTKSGFCQQFAVSMAVMLRELGIPARIAVGFTQGTEDPDVPDTYSITTKNLHVWVEVPFEGYGWLAFEPTPNRENPVALPYQAPPEERCVGPNCDGGQRPGERPGDIDEAPVRDPRVNTPPSGSASPPTAGRSRTTILVWAIGGLLGAAIAGVPFARWALRRRRLLRARGEPRRMVLATYEILTERAAGLGAARGPGETPKEYLQRLEASDRLDDGNLGRLTTLAIRAAYAPEGVEPDDVLDAQADAREVLRALRRTTPPLRRLAGTYRPRS
jgi:transglutaminase-like putative cysteine protease